MKCINESNEINKKGIFLSTCTFSIYFVMVKYFWLVFEIKHYLNIKLKKIRPELAFELVS